LKDKLVDIHKALDVLNKALEGKEYMAGNRVTLADIITGAYLVIPYSKVRRVYHKVQDYIGDCIGDSIAIL
jgi:glutathione S-transferase